LHEDHVSDLESVDKVLNTRAQVSASSPDVLDKSNFFRIDFEFFSQPPIVEFNALILEEDVLVWLVEDLDPDHHKARVVPTCQPDVIEVVKPEAKLRANQGIGGRVHLSSNAVWLEAKDTRSHVINIVPPTRNDWVSIDFGAGNASRGERTFE
jgi:hypothetical protein